MQSVQCYWPPRLGATARSIPIGERVTLVGSMFTPEGDFNTNQEQLIQGGGPCRPSPKRHRFTGQMRRQKNYNDRELMCIIYLPYIG